MERLNLSQTNKCTIRSSVHLLIVGKSHEHIRTIIDSYHPNHLSLFTSVPLKESTIALASLLHDNGISVSTTTINPFSSESIPAVITAIEKEYLRLLKCYPKETTEYFIGVTGGTNLMAIGAALAAYLFGLKVHYVLKPVSASEMGNTVMEIDIERQVRSLNVIAKA